MAILSPFLALDELRRAREEELRNSYSNLGKSFGDAALTAGNMIKQEQDRQREIADKKRAADLEQKKFEQDKVVDAANIETAKRAASVSEGRLGVDQGQLADERDAAGKAAAAKKLADWAEANVADWKGREAGDNPESLVHAAWQSDPEIGKRFSRDDVIAALEAEKAKRDAAAGVLGVKQTNAQANMARAEAAKKSADARAARIANRAAIQAKLPKMLPKLQYEVINLSNKVDNVNDLLEMKRAGNIDTGPVADIIARIREGIGAGDPNVAQFRAARMQIFNELLKDRSGSAVSADEKLRLEQELGRTMDPDLVFETIMRMAAEKAQRRIDLIINEQDEMGYQTPGSLTSEGKKNKKDSRTADTSSLDAAVQRLAELKKKQAEGK